MSLDARSQPAIAESAAARRLVELLARIHPMLLVYDAHGTIRWVSGAFDAFCADAPSKVGLPLSSLLPYHALDAQIAALRQRFEERGFLPNVCLEVATDGVAARSVEVSVLRLPELEGEGLFAVIARPAEAEPLALAPGAAEILEHAPDAILAVDAHGFVRFANPMLARLVGEDREQLRHRPLALLAATSRDIERLLEALHGAAAGELEVRLRRVEGGPLPVSVTVGPLRGPDGSPRGAVLCVRDATALRRQSALARRNDELEHCVQTLAHDLRSPLVALLGFSRLLRQDYGDSLDDTGAHFLDRIEQAGRTMEALIHDLLELSRIGQPGERPAMVDPRSVLLQLHGEVKPRLEAAGIRLVLPKDPPLVYCDRTRLYQVLSNLVGNAIHHMGPCSEPRIEVEVFEDEEFHRVSVRDVGRGIAPEHHERIFEVFQSLGTRSDGTRGTGIGLAIVRKIAETHGGRAWVESEPGRGATFHVTLRRR